MKEFLKKNLSVKTKQLLYRLFINARKLLLYPIIKGDRFTCPFCKLSFRKFLPSGLKSKVLKTKRVIGGQYRQNSICPWCDSLDRERLILLFIQNKKLLKKGMHLLHIAPEKNLQNFLKSKKINYYSADLKSPLAKVKTDIQNIPFENNFFDAIICNHVLEHIQNDKKAMKEIFRVIKPKGWAILQVPFSPILEKTFEDNNIKNPSERKKTFGQEDHVRIYGKDFFKRLKSVGFSVEQKYVEKNLVKKYALNPIEKVFFVTKANN